MPSLTTNRRHLLIAPLLAAAAAYLPKGAQAAGIDASQTILKTMSDIVWTPNYHYPSGTAETSLLSGDPTKEGQYFLLVKWYPGFMSAPHDYKTDRLCIVLSGTWYVANGEDFNPAMAVAAPAGAFVHRMANTVHYDGVIRTAHEPAIVAISGIGPAGYRPVDPGKPGFREI
ncbi:MAG: uncharacterized protein JWQ94_3303 [Tardiphaga sp.]|nr:uncharacterized protein [Tardiphaga sp.]